IIRAFDLQDQTKINPILHGRVKPGYAQAGYIVVDRQGRVKEKYFGNDFYDKYTANNVLAKLFPELLEGATKPVNEDHLQLVVKQSDHDVIAGNRVTLAVDIALPPGMHIY